MEINSYDPLLATQKKFYQSEKTFSFSYRKEALKKLRAALLMYEEDIYQALYKDLHKSKFESYATELGIVLDEINVQIKNLNRWAKPKKVSSNLLSFPSSSYILSEPLGTVLIFSPWNYPLQLLLAPLIGALAAGNTAILKPSEIAEHTAILLEKIINSTFEEDYVKVVNGGVDVAQKLLQLKVDHIFFTGSPNIGKIVMQQAAKNMIPVTLELGGKSPCIVDDTVDLRLAAKRIIWGKLINAGQTCIAPDYLLVHEKIKDKLIKELIKAIERFYGKNQENNSEYPHIISNPNMERLIALLENAEIVYGGNYNKENRFFQPTILDKVTNESPVMKQEIFGPVLPVISYNDINKVVSYVNNRPKPLALYIFSNNKSKVNKLVKKIPAGGVTVNDTVMHFVNSKLPFGGIGNSGIGNYHGKYSFETFSHKKSVTYRGNWPDVPVRYAPFKNKLKIIKKILK